MRAIALVAGAVFKESVRDRVPYSMVGFAVLLIAASYLISQLTAGQFRTSFASPPTPPLRSTE